MRKPKAHKPAAHKAVLEVPDIPDYEYSLPEVKPSKQDGELSAEEQKVCVSEGGG